MTTQRQHLDRAKTEIDGAIALIGDPLLPSGIPFVGEVRLPMLNLDKAWYETTQSPYFDPYNFHPYRCEDYNLETGGNTDLGEPLVSPFDGLVLSAHDWGGGTGRVVQILGVTQDGVQIVWAGWHLHTLDVASGQVVQVGQLIGSIGNADGRYKGAHLHNHICTVNQWGIPVPTTFPNDGRYDWIRPSTFYVEHGVEASLVRRVTAYDGA